jgi:hypothetical protein
MQISWSVFWAYYDTLPEKDKQACLEQLDLREFLKRLPAHIQKDVLDGASEGIMSLIKGVISVESKEVVKRKKVSAKKLRALLS